MLVSARRMQLVLSLGIFYLLTFSSVVATYSDEPLNPSTPGAVVSSIVNTGGSMVLTMNLNIPDDTYAFVFTSKTGVSGALPSPCGTGSNTCCLTDTSTTYTVSDTASMTALCNAGSTTILNNPASTDPTWATNSITKTSGLEAHSGVTVIPGAGNAYTFTITVAPAKLVEDAEYDSSSETYSYRVGIAFLSPSTTSDATSVSATVATAQFQKDDYALISASTSQNRLSLDGSEVEVFQVHDTNTATDRKFVKLMIDYDDTVFTGGATLAESGGSYVVEVGDSLSTTTNVCPEALPTLDASCSVPYTNWCNNNVAFDLNTPIYFPIPSALSSDLALTDYYVQLIIKLNPSTGDPSVNVFTIKLKANDPPTVLCHVDNFAYDDIKSAVKAYMSVGVDANAEKTEIENADDTNRYVNNQYTNLKTYSDAALAIEVDAVDFINSRTGYTMSIDSGIIINALSTDATFDTIKTAATAGTAFTVDSSFNIALGASYTNSCPARSGTISTCAHHLFMQSKTPDTTQGYPVFVKTGSWTGYVTEITDWIAEHWYGSIAPTSVAKALAQTYQDTHCLGGGTSTTRNAGYACLLVDVGFRWLTQSSGASSDSIFSIADKTLVALVVTIQDASGNNMRRLLSFESAEVPQDLSSKPQAMKRIMKMHSAHNIPSPSSKLSTGSSMVDSLVRSLSPVTTRLFTPPTALKTTLQGRHLLQTSDAEAAFREYMKTHYAGNTVALSVSGVDPFKSLAYIAGAGARNSGQWQFLNLAIGPLAAGVSDAVFLQNLRTVTETAGQNPRLFPSLDSLKVVDVKSYAVGEVPSGRRLLEVGANTTEKTALVLAEYKDTFTLYKEYFDCIYANLTSTSTVLTTAQVAAKIAACNPPTPEELKPWEDSTSEVTTTYNDNCGSTSFATQEDLVRVCNRLWSTKFLSYPKIEFDRVTLAEKTPSLVFEVKLSGTLTNVETDFAKEEIIFNLRNEYAKLFGVPMSHVYVTLIKRTPAASRRLLQTSEYFVQVQIFDDGSLASTFNAQTAYDAKKAEVQAKTTSVSSYTAAAQPTVVAPADAAAIPAAELGFRLSFDTRLHPVNLVSIDDTTKNVAIAHAVAAFATYSQVAVNRLSVVNMKLENKGIDMQVRIALSETDAGKRCDMVWAVNDAKAKISKEMLNQIKDSGLNSLSSVTTIDIHNGRSWDAKTGEEFVCGLSTVALVLIIVGAVLVAALLVYFGWTMCFNTTEKKGQSQSQPFPGSGLFGTTSAGPVIYAKI